MITIGNNKNHYIFAVKFKKKYFERRCQHMLIIPVKEGENIDRALKRFKRKFLKTGTLKQVRSRKQYIKKSERLRVQKQKAVYSENMLRDMD